MSMLSLFKISVFYERPYVYPGTFKLLRLYTKAKLIYFLPYFAIITTFPK